MANSVATIFTMDIYQQRINTKASEKQLLKMGRIAAISSVVVAAIIAQPLLGKLDQAFQYIQEFTGFFTPGIVVIFVTGIFWKRTTANAALASALISAIGSLLLKLFWPELAFMDRVGLIFVICLAATIIISLMDKQIAHPKAVDISEFNFATSKGFNLASLAVVIVLVALYTTWW